MRQWIGMVLTVTVVLVSGVVFADNKAQNKTEAQPGMQMPAMKDSGMMGQGMMGKGMTGGGMMGKGKMEGCMIEKKIVATQDGGVVVWIGNKLIKYNKDLKLVNEAELNVDMGQMKQKMMDSCSKMGCSGGQFQPVYPYHRKPGKTQAEEDVDPHAIDPYHHAPKN